MRTAKTQPGRSRSRDGPDLQAVAFAEHLAGSAAGYFRESENGAARVSLTWKKVRDRSTAYGFEVETGGAMRHRILIKVLPAEDDPQPPTGDPAKDRPRLTAGFGLETKLRCRREYQTLTAVHEQVAELGDPRVDAVRVYEVLPEDRAIVMELVSRPTLREIAKASAFRFRSVGSPDPPTPFRNAGAWLRMYHSLPRPDPLVSRHTRRDEFVAHTISVTKFLGLALGQGAYFSGVAEVLERAATALLPESLPVGLGHGDYAMRNILVGPGGAVSVIDTTGTWRTSIYEDIGYFLTDLKCNAGQVFSRGKLLGRRRLAGYERAFLEGYFGRRADLPIGAVRLYEIQALLDKWAAIAADRRRAETVASRLLTGLRLRSTSSYFRSVLEAHSRGL